MQAKIYNLSLEILEYQDNFERVISKDMTNNYYWSDDWSEELYIKLAKLGFISTTYDTKEGLVLLPELQFAYSILDFKNLHISKKVRKLLHQSHYKLSFGTHFEEIIQKIGEQHRDNWFKNEYVSLMQKLSQREDFDLKGVALLDAKTEELVAGEIGYSIGKTYTSLTGFSSRKKEHRDCGTLQLVLLAKKLERDGYSFWNLGHPHMEYKKRLGAVTYTREDFLKRWQEARDLII